MSKNVPKCPNVFWGDFSEKFFVPSVPWIRRKFSQKSEKNSKLQKCPKSFPKESKRVWTCLGAIFRIFLCPVFHAGRFRFSGLEVMCSDSRI